MRIHEVRRKEKKNGDRPEGILKVVILCLTILLAADLGIIILGTIKQSGTSQSARAFQLSDVRQEENVDFSFRNERKEMKIDLNP